MKLYCKKIDFFSYILIAVITLRILISNINFSKDPFVYFTFILIGITAFYNLVKDKRTISSSINFNIFFYVFFFLAPWQQYSSDFLAWRGNGLSIKYSDTDYLKANIIILIFLVIFNYVYRKKSKEYIEANSVEYVLDRESTIIIFIMNVVCITLLIVSKNLYSFGWGSNTSLGGQVWNIIKFIPVCSIFIYAMAFRDRKKLIKKGGFIFSIFLFCIVYFPFWGNMPRFLLFGNYIIVLAIWFSRTKNKSLYFLGLFFGFLLMFSSSRYVTNIGDLLTMNINFNHVDFDAYQLLMTLVRYTDENGIVFGKNILSALSFLIPRSIWSGKLENSGAIAVGFYGSWFKNVSSPLVAECYFAFGFFGILFIPIFLAKLLAKVDGWYNETSIFRRGVYLLSTGMTIYICRGSLLASLAFTLGLFLFIILISKMVRIKNLTCNIKTIN